VVFDSERPFAQTAKRWGTRIVGQPPTAQWRRFRAVVLDLSIRMPTKNPSTAPTSAP
jgi:hypothetical protein